MSSKFNIINKAMRSLGQDPVTSLTEDTENMRKVDDIYDITLKALLRSHPWSFAKKEVALSRVVATDTASWVTLTDYEVDDFVTSSGTTYQCEIAHTSGTFATDLAAGYWVAATDYESPVLDDFLYVFQLPNDFLALLRTSVQDSGYAHKIKGRKLYSNSDDVDIEYIYFVTDPDAWATSTAYKIGDYVLQSNEIYFCLTAHTSGTFATDLAADKWVQQDIYDAAFTEALAANLAFELCYAITKSEQLLKIKQDEFLYKLRMAKSINGQEVTPDSPQQDDWINSRT